MSSEDDRSVISIQKVNKIFGTKKAITDLSLEIKRGDFFGFLGPNGAGKTTTIRMILDVLRPSSGSIKLFGESNRKVVQAHQKIGFLSGDMVLEDDLTGFQYLNFIDHAHGGNHQARIKELADLLQANLKIRISNYSRGNKQKIGLIAALMHNPELLILDEPTDGFDPLIQEIFSDLMKKYMSSGGTIFMSSHILSEVQQLCKKVAFIREGSIVGIKSIEELTHSNSKRIELVINEKGAAELSKDYHKLIGLSLMSRSGKSMVFSYDGDIKKMLDYFAHKNLSDISIKEPELEDAFMDYYKNHDQ